MICTIIKPFASFVYKKEPNKRLCLKNRGIKAKNETIFDGNFQFFQNHFVLVKYMICTIFKPFASFVYKKEPNKALFLKKNKKLRYYVQKSDNF
jgi:hypothetical protein